MNDIQTEQVMALTNGAMLRCNKQVYNLLVAGGCRIKFTDGCDAEVYLPLDADQKECLRLCVLAGMLPHEGYAGNPRVEFLGNTIRIYSLLD